MATVFVHFIKINVIFCDFEAEGRGVDPGGCGVDPPENVTFFHLKLLLYNCKFHNVKDEHLDIITSLILLMLTMLPSYF